MPRTINPKSLQNLRPAWQRGQSGNPHGPKVGEEKISFAYARLLKMSAEELGEYKPKTAAEAIAYRQISTAIWDAEPLPSAKEITDRTEGKAKDRQYVFQLDVSKLTAEQLERIASGEHPSLVVDVEADQVEAEVE